MAQGSGIMHFLMNTLINQILLVFDSSDPEIKAILRIQTMIHVRICRGFKHINTIRLPIIHFGHPTTEIISPLIYISKINVPHSLHLHGYLLSLSSIPHEMFCGS